MPYTIRTKAMLVALCIAALAVVLLEWISAA
jgi:hypothetical protein